MSIECKVIQELKLEERAWFIGEVVAATRRITTMYPDLYCVIDNLASLLARG